LNVIGFAPHCLLDTRHAVRSQREFIVWPGIRNLLPISIKTTLSDFKFFLQDVDLALEQQPCTLIALITETPSLLMGQLTLDA